MRDLDSVSSGNLSGKSLYASSTGTLGAAQPTLATVHKSLLDLMSQAQHLDGELYEQIKRLGGSWSAPGNAVPSDQAESSFVGIVGELDSVVRELRATMGRISRTSTALREITG